MDFDVLWRVLAAAALASAVGIEREASGQSAGLRTHVTVAIGACLFGVISTLGFEEFVAVRATTNYQVDVTRVASNVVVGVGFLGAGLIFRQGGHVKNLTTAASLWATAAIGLAAGVGDPGAAAVTTAVLVVTLLVLRPVRGFIETRFVHERHRVRIVLERASTPDEIVGTLRRVEELSIKAVIMEKEAGLPVAIVALRAKPGFDIHAVLAGIAGREEVVSLSDEFEQ